ncbi:MAG: serine/threonine-protein kinase [Myxococcota bacterium]
MDGSELPAGTVVDRYTVEGVVGYGGMAVVWKVRHNDLGSLHALKVLQTRSRVVRERLVQEGRLQASMRHPNLVAVTDLVVLDGGDPGLIMELVQGPSLRVFLDQGPLTLEQADVIAAGILAGVAEAHRCDLVHRDLKPANILLEPGTGTFVPKVADFGIAKALANDSLDDAFRTRTGAVMGTPHYMAPEQILDSSNVGPQADIFALGVVLYELVTHQRPFDGDTSLAVCNAVTAGLYEPPELHAPELPRSMQEAIRAALSVDPEERPASVEALTDLWFADRLPPPSNAKPFPGVERITSRHQSRGAITWDPPSPPSVPALGRWPRTLALLAAGLGLGGLGMLGVGVYTVSQLLAEPAVEEPPVAVVAVPAPEPLAVVEPAGPPALAPEIPKPVPAPVPVVLSPPEPEGMTLSLVSRLARQGGEAAWRRLGTAVRGDPDPKVRAAAWNAVLRGWNDERPGVSGLEATLAWQLERAPRNAAVAAAVALGDHGRRAESLIPGLRRRLPRVRLATLDAVLKLRRRTPGFNWRPHVRPLTKAESALVRQKASRVLRKL